MNLNLKDITLKPLFYDFYLWNLIPFKIVILLFFSFISITGYSQGSENSQLKKLYEFSYTNNDSLVFYSQKLINSKNNCNKYKALNYLAKAYYQTKKIDTAILISNKVLKELKNETQSCLILEKLSSYNRLFWIYKNLGQYNKAFEVALERKELSESLPEDSVYYAHIISVNHNLAVIKNIMGFYDEARRIFKENYALLPKVYNQLIDEEYYYDKKESSYFLTLNQTSTLNLLGETHLNSSKNANSASLDSASYYFRRAYKVAQNFNPPHPNTETLYQLREAEVLLAKNKYQKSLSLVNRFNDNAKKYNTYQKINALKALNFHYLEMRDSALIYCNKFLINYKKEKNNKDKLIAIYDILSKEYYQTKKIDSAYKYSELTLSELNLFNKNKNLVNKSHYLHNYNNIKNLNSQIIEDDRNKQKWLKLSLIFLVVLVFIFSFLILKARIKKNSFDTSKSITKEANLNTEATTYNIDYKTEKKILEGILKFERDNGFLNQDFTINSFAKKLNTNTTYLSVVFNKNYNKNFKQYITSLRIDYLINELHKNSKLRNYTIKALAEEIGYTNASSFTRAFKKYKGVTPSEFIKSLQ